MLLALALSACTIKFDADLAVNEDESGTFAIVFGFDEEVAAGLERFAPDLDLMDQLNELGEVDGWTTEEVTEDGFEGVRASTEFSSFDDLDSKLVALDTTGAGGFAAGALSRFDLEHVDDTFSFEADITGLTEELGGSFGDFPIGDIGTVLGSGNISDIFDAEFHLSLPGSIDQHNADTVNGSNLTWDLTFDDSQEVLSATSSLGGDNSALFVGDGAVVLVGLVGAGVFAARRRKSNVEREAVEQAGL